MNFKSAWPFLAACFLVLSLGSGCATNGRHILLKEYAATGPSGPEDSMKGITVCFNGFEVGPHLTGSAATKAEEITDFKYTEFTKAQRESWDQEFRKLEDAGTDKQNWLDIGYLRNGFGMTMSHIFSMNDPAAWLQSTLAMDFKALGAKVVEGKSAGVCLGGTIVLFQVDSYMKVWADLVVDLQYTVKGRTESALLHTTGSGMNWVAGTYEFYSPLRESRQKLSYLVVRRILRALKRGR